MISIKNLITWRDSNPGLLFLRRTWCILRHAATAIRTYFTILQYKKTKLIHDWKLTSPNVGTYLRQTEQHFSNAAA
jgi:hypothetical protein